MIDSPSVFKLPVLTSVACLAALAGLALAAPPAPAAGPASEPAGAPAEGRVVLLGFDGADARTIRQLLAESPQDYPHMARLAAEGTFAPLEVVAPPESPVSWAAINTGQNPAKTGVPGFVRRSLERGFPMPDLGHMKDDEAPIETFENTPIPVWSAGKLAGVWGGGGFVIGIVFGLVVFRKRKALALLPALLLGGAGGTTGFMARALLPDTVPFTANPNQARNLWDFAADAGVPSIVLDAAQAFSMPSPDGARVLAGLGVPDARGGIGDWFVYTTDPDEFEREGRKTTTAGTVFRVDEYDGRIDTKIYGPKNFWLEQTLKKALETTTDAARKRELEDEIEAIESSRKLDGRTEVDMSIELADGAARVTIGGQTQTVAVGEWSDFYELRFEMNQLLRVDALTRVRLVRLEPYFELFVNVLDVDPRNPPFWQPISTPHGFAKELADECGLYETYGWPTATMPVKDGEVDPELLMEDVEFTMKWRERLTHAALARHDWRLLMSVFSTTDRVQHMMYRYWDEEHPLFEREVADRTMTFFGETIRLGDAIPAIYRQMDRVIGDVLERMEPDDTLLVCSDHGFQSFRRQVNLNNWLAENGYLTPKANASKRTATALLFVDWAKTRVYSLGMGFLYLNLEGREPDGIVPPEEADALMAEVREKLLAATDPDTGARFCSDVYVVGDIHSGPHIDLESDMIVGFAPPYRVSWSTTSGGLHMAKDGSGTYRPGPVCTDNDSPWSGGHVSLALDAVAGVFLSNRKVEIPDAGVRALQVAPTALALLGVPTPQAMDLEPLRFE